MTEQQAREALSMVYTDETVSELLAEARRNGYSRTESLYVTHGASGFQIARIANGWW